MKYAIFFLLFFCGAVIFYPGTAQQKPGQYAPDIAVRDVQGNMKKLSDQKGKVVLVDFWASWCGPCRKANPSLLKLYTKYRQNGFEIFGVSIDDDKAAWKKAITRDKITWIQVNDSGGWDGPIATAYKIEQIPTSYLLDKSGMIIAIDPSHKDLEKKIVELLNKL